MNAKGTDLARIQEVYDVIKETQRQMAGLEITYDRFVSPASDADDLIAEGILNRVLRATEEAGKISEEIAQAYGFDLHGVSGVRNRLAHAYGEVDRDIIWTVIQEDFSKLVEACERFADDCGIELV